MRRMNIPTRTALILSLVILALLPAQNTIAARFKVVKGEHTQVCEAYKRNLESFDENRISPLICERPINPDMEGFSNPLRRPLDISKHRELFKNILGYLGAASKSVLENSEKYEELIRREGQFNRLSAYDPPIDVNNDGHPDNLISFRGGLCREPDRTSRTYRTVILALRKDGSALDKKLSGQLLGVHKQGHSTMDVFVYKGVTYFDFWASAEVSGDRYVLYVFKLNQDHATNVCRLSYESGRLK